MSHFQNLSSSTSTSWTCSSRSARASGDRLHRLVRDAPNDPGQPDRLSEWKTLRSCVASALVEVECLRTLDRLKIREGIADSEIATRREAVFRLVEEMEIVEPTRPVLARASQPLPTPLGTLDAIHLATALLWQEKERKDLVMATHDLALGIAARACGLRVAGV